MYLVILGAGWSKSARAKANSLPYVATVEQQIANLPAQDVLLRGSDQPLAARDELLRAARERAEGDTDELLRPLRGGEA